MRKFIIITLLLILSNVILGETVYDIQYTTDPGGASPLEGSTVTVTGIVTAINWYVSGNANRFFISDPEGGEWHGIFVFNYDYTVALGDEVEVTAEVQEYYGFTELSNVSDVTILSSGNTVPDPIDVTTADLAATEAYESVLVRVNGVTVTQDPNDYGEAYIDDGSGECQTDDAMYSYDPVAGNEYEYIIGIVDYSYDEYGLNPRSSMDVAAGGEPGYIEGVVSLDGGTGNLEDVIINAGGYTTNPDEYGEYDIELPVGTYDVTASLAGYSPQTISDVVVEEEETTSGIDFILAPMAVVNIYDIQFTEEASGDSPYMDQVVTVSGIVSGAGFGGNNFFYIIDEDGGAWNGLYVYQYDVEVAQGDNVTVTGTISEYYGFTELGNVTEIIINSSGNTLPDPVEISTAELASTEAYESVLVKISDVAVTVAPNDYNEWFVDDGSGECQVDDGFGAIPSLVEVDDEFESITGIVDYSYDEYGLNPRSLNDFNSGGTPEVTPIYDIQYTEDASGDSPYAGQTVIVEGIVSGAGYNTDYYFIISSDGGAWNGIYVYDDVNSPQVGDMVRISAEVYEYFNFTELQSITAFEVLSSGNDLPEPVVISTAELASSEAYESVLVRIEDLTVTALPNDYNEWFVDDGSGECQIDDGFGYIPEGIEVGSPNFQTITGIVDYSYSEYGLNPRSQEDFETLPADDDNIISANSLKAYPNPYNPGMSRSLMKFSYELETSTDVNLAIYNVKGQKVKQLVNEAKPAGKYDVSWKGDDNSGSELPAGVYFYQLKSDNGQQTDKLLLIR